MTIQETAKSKIIVLDGAMGTRLERCGLSEEDFRGRDFAGWENENREWELAKNKGENP